MFANEKSPIKFLFVKGKPWYKKWWVWIVYVIIFAILVSIPFLINFAYMKGLKMTEPNTAYTASDLLSFYGTILGAVTTIIALIATIRFTAYQSIKEQKLQRIKLIAEYKKVEIERKNNEILEYADKIKNLYLLKMIDYSHNWLENIFRSNRVNIFMSKFENLHYWIQKLNFSNSTIESEFITLLIEFEENVRNSAISLSKELEELKNYKNKYDKEKQEYEEKKKKFLDENPGYLIKMRLKGNKSDEPPYGKFLLNEPESESVFSERFIENLEIYRDNNEESFLSAYDDLLDYKRKIMIEEIDKLYDFNE